MFVNSNALLLLLSRCQKSMVQKWINKIVWKWSFISAFTNSMGDDTALLTCNKEIFNVSINNVIDRSRVKERLRVVAGVSNVTN